MCDLRIQINVAEVKLQQTGHSEAVAKIKVKLKVKAKTKRLMLGNVASNTSNALQSTEKTVSNFMSRGNFRANPS